jgi:hypothetical protein
VLLPSPLPPLYTGKESKIYRFTLSSTRIEENSNSYRFRVFLHFVLDYGIRSATRDGLALYFVRIFSSNKCELANKKKDFDTSRPPKNDGIGQLFVLGGLKLSYFKKFKIKILYLKHIVIDDLTKTLQWYHSQAAI